MTLAFRTPVPRPDTRPDRTAPSPGTGTGTGTGTPVHDARRLTGPNQTGHITLDDKTYVLRITRAGKLILTK